MRKSWFAAPDVKAEDAEEGLRGRGRGFHLLVVGFMKVTKGITIEAGFTHKELLALDAKMPVLVLDKLVMH